MPITYTDSDGNEMKGGTLHITGGSCIGCAVVIMLAIVGLGTLIGSLAGLPL